MTNSVIRRYTPPTCRLQILAHSSPVSRRVGRSVEKQLRFEISFDDPRLPEQQVLIQGESEQLLALHKAVTAYVQNLLNSSPEQFNGVLSAVVPATPGSSDLNTDERALSEETQPNNPFSASAHLVDPVLRSEEPTVAPSEQIFLQHGDGLSHNLFLGELANKESGAVIQLSVLQLFDLATALDEYASDVIALPAANRSRVTAGPSAWASIAAVLLIGVGLTTAILILNRSNSQQQTANKNTTPEPLAPQSSPVPTLPSSSPQSPSLPPTSSIFASPSPSSPTVIPETTSTLPVVPSVPIPQTTSVNPIPSLTPAPPISVSPIPRQDTSVSIFGETAIPKTSGIPTPTDSAPPSITIPRLSQLPLPSPDPQKAPAAATPDPVLTLGDTPTTPQKSASAQTRSPSLPTIPNQPTGTAFDTIPQVAEARDYFKQRWEPPASLKQTLQYSLVLDVDGTIQRIEPLGEAARTYVDRTGMPLIGEQFVSGLSNGQTPRLRVVLAPDGKVQTFLEEDAPPAAAKSPNNRRLEGANLPLRNN